MSKVIVAKRLLTLDKLKSDLTAKYGTARKEDLKDEHAKELYGYLRGIL